MPIDYDWVRKVKPFVIGSPRVSHQMQNENSNNCVPKKGDIYNLPTKVQLTLFNFQK